MEHKDINITGKKCTDKLIPKEKSIRLSSEKWESIPALVNTKNHLSLLKKIFMEVSFFGDNLLKNELSQKINSYKNQDIKKQIHQPTQLITLEQLTEKLILSKLVCHYCHKKIKLLYQNVRDPEQWTLDRIDNNLPHTNDNTVICDLKCNLQRRCQNKDTFYIGKNLTITKLE